jgi:hypothetical protein
MESLPREKTGNGNAYVEPMLVLVVVLVRNTYRFTPM